MTSIPRQPDRHDVNAADAAEFVPMDISKLPRVSATDRVANLIARNPEGTARLLADIAPRVIDLRDGVL